jgi:DNA-binding transcriptional ArsR family regulator
MSRAEALAAGAELFAALGDRTRLGLLSRLAAGSSLPIVALSQDGELTRQAVTKHLTVLERVGLVSRLKVGRETRYACRPEGLAHARALLDGVSASWDDAIDRLRVQVEADEP